MNTRVRGPVSILPRLGTILVAIGDGLVIPKMKEFGYIFKGQLGIFRVFEPAMH